MSHGIGRIAEIVSADRFAIEPSGVHRAQINETSTERAC
jgi:hypothetical protein